MDQNDLIMFKMSVSKMQTRPIFQGKMRQTPLIKKRNSTISLCV
jgi:hypothetical protein